jgi:outer membrane protein OmpA-like peptidoglycan-associated protein
MYAISSVSEGRYRVVSESLVKAFQTTEPTYGAASKNGLQMRWRTTSTRCWIRSSATGRVHLTQNARGIAVEINASVLFEPGQAELQGDSAQVLDSVAKVLAAAPNALEIEGHTDDSPINSPVFPSNWELSAARASRVVRLLAQGGVCPRTHGRRRLRRVPRDRFQRHPGRPIAESARDRRHPAERGCRRVEVSSSRCGAEVTDCNRRGAQPERKRRRTNFATTDESGGYSGGVRRGRGRAGGRGIRARRRGRTASRCGTRRGAR